MRARAILVGLLFTLAFVCMAGNAYFVFFTSYFSSSPGWWGQMNNGHYVVTTLASNGPKDVLQIGDEIVAFNGQKIQSQANPRRFFRFANLGTNYTLTVRRDGITREMALHTVPVSTEAAAMTVMQSLIVPAIFLFIGLGVFLLKPYDNQALLLAVGFAAIGIPTEAIFIAPQWLKLFLGTGFVASSFAAALLLHLMLVFPEPSPLLRRFPRLEYLLYIPQLLFVPANVTVVLQMVSGQEDLVAYLPKPIEVADSILFLIYIIGAVISLVVNYRHAGPLSRRKLRVVMAATVMAAIPVIALQIVALLYSTKIISSAFFGDAVVWLALASLMALPPIPVAFAYAIIRHQVIPVSLIIRRSLQYLLAKNALRILLALPLIGLTFLIIANRERNLSDILFRNSFHFYVLLLAALAIGLFFRRHLTDWIDRKFFREAYSQEKILRELIDDVKKLDSIPEMSKRVTEQVNRALHPEKVYLFYRAEDARVLSLSYSSGGASEEIKIPEDFQLLRFMELHGGAQEFPFPQKNTLPSTEKEWLSQLGTRLIVPLSSTDSRLAGLFLLGLKKSEVPYTASDRELLETLADQIAIVYENVHLKERVQHERKIKREVLARFDEQQINLLKECPQCGACFDSSVQTCSHDGIELTLSLPVEREIEGRYRLDRLIGRGGMGAVYEATDTRLNRRVAVKILTGSMFGNSEALRRFEREAQASARLNHPNIVTVFDYGVLQTEGAYLVMEVLRGETLGASIKRKGCVTCALAAELFDQVLEAIKAAHQAGVIHRDLKPENVFITHAEQSEHTSIKVLDFGLAKFSTSSTAEPDGTTTPMTSPGTVMGTFGYMSPEQLTGGEVDERSDIFSVGVMVVEALTGCRPFAGKTYTELLTNVLHGSFHLPVDSTEAQRLDEALQKCLAKEREARFNSAAETQKALVKALRDCPAITPASTSAPDADTFIIKG
ncbi:MAG TPA: protein kinase [Pyrinomonadaceae bacterium]|jgi:membrane-associated protease RseP (regulator of RpoE activity)